MEVAMISYNTFVCGEGNGWKKSGDNRVLLLQNERGSTWGISQGPTSQAGLKAGAVDCVNAVTSLWDQLTEALPSIDKVIFYVGSFGAERVIELSAEYGLPPEKAVFVHCDCNMSVKMKTIVSRGFSSSKVVGCECGGHMTMLQIYRNVLNNGSLPD